MTEPFAHPCVLVVADRERTDELVAALAELPSAEVLVSAGGDDTLELFDARRPAVVVLTASLHHGDPRALIATLRGKVPRAEIAIVVLADEVGPIRTALDALDLAPDRFVTRPLSPKALRFAVTGGLDAVRLVRGMPLPTPLPAVPWVTVAAPVPSPVQAAPASVSRAELRARWAALADSMIDEPKGSDEPTERGEQGEPAPPSSPVVIMPRRRSAEPLEDAPSADGWRDEVAGDREATTLVREPAPPDSRTRTDDGELVVAARTSSEELWSESMPISELVDREPRPEAPVSGDLDLPPADPADPEGSEADEPPGGDPVGPARFEPVAAASEPRDFARELRAKMSIMAQRLFQGSDAPARGAADHAPRHDHHTEIDLASLGDEPGLGRIVAELEASAPARHEGHDVLTPTDSWDTQVRERGLPDSGTILRGVSDAAMLLARMFAQGSTGRVGFRRGDVETVVYFDHGRPVFASSNEPHHRMGELLRREGKITASQYERCQAVVAESGRRMGEILVDLGYLKRRELLPAVRRHVEDLVYSLFGWEHGTYYIVSDPQPSAERIRLSRHPAALVLEGIRRKLDRTSLDRLIGPSSTVIEVRDRERLGGIVHLSDLSAEERAALAAFDGQADLAQVAHTAGVDLADVLPLVWGLCVLGLATARRADAELADEGTALIGETNLAIDRERVRARWQLVTDADYFALLGVRRDATAFEIRRAYQSARRDFAADCFPSDLRRELARELDEIAQVLDEAFRVLRDDRLRQHYLANLIDG